MSRQADAGGGLDGKGHLAGGRAGLDVDHGLGQQVVQGLALGMEGDQQEAGKVADQDAVARAM
jgi:hypothetical protein